jgi:hypothetical protein
MQLKLAAEIVSLRASGEQIKIAGARKERDQAFRQHRFITAKKQGYHRLLVVILSAIVYGIFASELC